jgi:hypothetical protein
VTGLSSEMNCLACLTPSRPSEMRMPLAFFRTLLSGARREEVLTIQWSHLNPFRREWMMPRISSRTAFAINFPAAAEQARWRAYLDLLALANNLRY